MGHEPSSVCQLREPHRDEEERQIRDMQRDVLSALTSSMSFEETGNFMCHRIQQMAPGVLVSVCRIADNRMCPWAAPDFPAEYGEHFAGMEIGEGVASCGTAAYRNDERRRVLLTPGHYLGNWPSRLRALSHAA